MSCVFFYGLFMDATLLEDKGLHPTSVSPARLPGYQIHIGNRASLIQNPRSTAYGMLIDLPEAELMALYSDPGVSDYRPEHVSAVLLQDQTIRPAVCYNLPATGADPGSNARYAGQLSALVLELGFPPVYAGEITGLATPRARN